MQAHDRGRSGTQDSLQRSIPSKAHPGDHSSTSPAGNNLVCFSLQIQCSLQQTPSHARPSLTWAADTHNRSSVCYHSISHAAMQTVTLLLRGYNSFAALQAFNKRRSSSAAECWCPMNPPHNHITLHTAATLGQPRQMQRAAVRCTSSTFNCAQQQAAVLQLFLATHYALHAAAQQEGRLGLCKQCTATH